MSDELYVILSIAAFVLAGVWLASCYFLFHRLKNNHNEQWIALGKPTLFNHLATNLHDWLKPIRLIFKIIVGKIPNTFNDNTISLTIWIMRIVAPTLVILGIITGIEGLYR